MSQYIIKWHSPSMNTSGVSEEGLYNSFEEAMSTAKRLVKADSSCEYVVVGLGTEYDVSKVENVREAQEEFHTVTINGQTYSITYAS